MYPALLKYSNVHKIQIIIMKTIAALLLTVSASMAAPAILIPTIVSTANENPFLGQGFTFVTDNSGMSPGVNNGDSLAAAQSAVHSYGGYAESFVTEASTTDYFDTGVGNAAQPSVVFDLGTDTLVSNILLWQYQNDGGGSVNVGNHTRLLDLRFNTAAQGSGSFGGAPVTITMLPVLDGDGVGGNDMGGVNGAQTFGLSNTARYVQLTITDNYRGWQGITGGGDRAGLGEVRFYGGAVPEASTAGLMLLASGMFLRRRR